MIPAVPLLIRASMLSLLMLIANGFAWAAGWITPEITAEILKDLTGDDL